MLQDTEELQSRMETPENLQRMSEERERLQEARDQAQRAAEALDEERVSQAAASGTRAEQNIEELRNEFRRRASGRFSEEMQQMREAARELAEQEGEFDADTRWALAWFDQYGFTEGAYGQAETLSTAKNTSVSGMVEAGILAAKGGKVRLLKKEELPPDWDPAADTRLTIWESTHYLIRALDQGELRILVHRADHGYVGVVLDHRAQLGLVARAAEPVEDHARDADRRDLSYRLYTVCERRKWSQDAIGYNALVLAWPDLTRLAQEQKAAGPSQGEMIL